MRKMNMVVDSVTINIEGKGQFKLTREAEKQTATRRGRKFPWKCDELSRLEVSQLNSSIPSIFEPGEQTNTPLGNLQFLECDIQSE
ncbi:hypothetical protein [Vibrio harveyi]|uniref:hypothetical protein n=1 Tax=Vibrio harveyi TaxID=669 RepID=UPI003CEAC1D4